MRKGGARETRDGLGFQSRDGFLLDHSQLATCLPPPPPEMPSCAACGVDNAAKRCSRCKTVSYCSPDCQKSDWKAHKARCKRVVALAALMLPAVQTEQAYGPDDEVNRPAASALC